MRQPKFLNSMLLRNFDSAADLYSLPSLAIFALILLPFLLFLLLSFFSLPICYDLHPYFWGEGKIVETAQFIILLIATVISLALSWRTAVLGERRYIRIFYLIFGLGMLFIAGEEVAWGQQYLNFKTPGFLQSINTQNEFTFHNFGIFQDRSNLLNLFFAAAGCLGIYFCIRGNMKKISVPVLLAPWLGLILVLAVFGIIFNLYLGDRSLNYPSEYVFHIQTETAELLIALVGFLYPLLNRHLYFSPIKEAGQVQIQANSESIDIFPLKVTYALGALVSGISCMVWLAFIPGESGSAVWLGLSKTRLTMVAFGLGIILLITYLLLRSARDKTWLNLVSESLNNYLMKPPILWTITLSGCLVLISCGTSLIAAYTHPDRYITGILSRLAPWLLWILIISLETLHLTIPRLLPLSRLRLQQVDSSTNNQEKP